MKTHTDVVCTRDADGIITVDWRDGDPEPGDYVLMSIELFCQMIDASNVEASNRKSRSTRSARFSPADADDYHV